MTQRGRASGRSTAGPRSGDRPRGDLSARRQRLRAVIEPVIADAGYDLEDLSVSRAGRRHVVRVIVDGDAGVSLDAVADVSRSVSKALDRAEETGGDLVAGEYQLEVSSPGVDRPLTLPRHWRRNVGRLVKVTAKVTAGAPAQRDAEPRAGAVPATERQVTGRVLAADEDGVEFDLSGERARWTYPELGAGRVQVEFTRLDEDETTEDDSTVDDDELVGPAADDDDELVGRGADEDEDVEDEER
ncbi:ribosome maturation factor RimP [Plantactinospora sp. GCM10030261]|uniref:ribosome maturation factor RimP n=1 Tax=Plantactinospora sp. GCM10030261 TaxID=3273420 RepID=UPI0036070713